MTALHPRLPTPASISGCGKKFLEGEWAITWNHGGGPRGARCFWYNHWSYDEQQYNHVFRCGIGMHGGNPGNDTTYYCKGCLVVAGLIW